MLGYWTQSDQISFTKLPISFPAEPPAELMGKSSVKAPVARPKSKQRSTEVNWAAMAINARNLFKLDGCTTLDPMVVVYACDARQSSDFRIVGRTEVCSNRVLSFGHPHCHSAIHIVIRPYTYIMLQSLACYSSISLFSFNRLLVMGPCMFYASIACLSCRHALIIIIYFYLFISNIIIIISFVFCLPVSFLRFRCLLESFGRPRRKFWRESGLQLCFGRFCECSLIFLFSKLSYPKFREASAVLSTLNALICADEWYSRRFSPQAGSF